MVEKAVRAGGGVGGGGGGGGGGWLDDDDDDDGFWGSVSVDVSEEDPFGGGSARAELLRRSIVYTATVMHSWLFSCTAFFLSPVRIFPRNQSAV